MLICLQVALNLDHIKKQWVDIGIHTNACMTRPETCGEAGGAISVWLKDTGCPDWGGILSSYAVYGKSGSLIYCRTSRIR